MTMNEFKNKTKKIKDFFIKILFLKKIKSILLMEIKNPFDIQDFFTFTGLGSVSYGCYDIYEPAGFIIYGILAFWLAVRKVS